MTRQPRTPEEWQALARRPRRTPKTLEEAFPLRENAWQAEVLRTARLCGFSLQYHPWISINSPSGWPDIVLVRPPRVIIAELKTDKGPLRPRQRVWLEALSACPGVEIYLWRPKDRENVIKILASEERPADGMWPTSTWRS